jgi:hypothetical protein
MVIMVMRPACNGGSEEDCAAASRVLSAQGIALGGLFLAGIIIRYGRVLKECCQGEDVLNLPS